MIFTAPSSIPFPEGFAHVMAFLDPASGKQELKRVSSRSAIVVGGIDFMNRVVVLDIWADRAPVDVIFEKIYSMFERWRPSLFGIESVGQQNLFVQSVIRDAHECNIPVNVCPVTCSTHVTKEFRIRAALQPLIANGMLLLEKEKHGELLKEIKSFPLGAVVDLIDALASLVRMLPKRNTQTVLDEDMRNRLDYLRAAGAPPAYIHAVARGEEPGDAHYPNDSCFRRLRVG